MAGRICVWTSRKRRVLLTLLFRSFAWNFHRSMRICAFVRNWPHSRLRECDCSLYLFCHNFLQSQPEFTLAGRSYQCTSSADPCLPTSTFDCWTTSVEHISQRENTLLQPFRLRGSGCLRFLLSSNHFVFVFGVTDLLHTWSACAGLSLTLRIHCLTSNVPCKPNGWRKCLLQMRPRAKLNNRNQ